MFSLPHASTAQVAAIRTDTTDIDGTVWEGRVARWLVDGQIAYDRHGHLQYGILALTICLWAHK
jgi:hypothetical protein